MTQPDSAINTEQNIEQTQTKDPMSQADQRIKPAFAPYQNDHQSLQIGSLIFENQTDKIIVYGDIDIQKTPEGLSQAMRLQALFSDIVSELQAAQSTGELEPISKSQGFISEQTQNSKEVDNPFS
ncbi:hypothetical protein [Psychrobacter sp. H7-1]|uniref:hypothetical protein n=1 Tax=Psychrobacter sp. H7-1 TaxID=1569265 RepID=UPI001D120EAB|nr:hypothetical protein [Psychrobacter sp. H7-1]